MTASRAAQRRGRARARIWSRSAAPSWENNHNLFSPSPRGSIMAALHLPCPTITSLMSAYESAKARAGTVQRSAASGLSRVEYRQRMNRKVVLYSGGGCHLCEDVHEVLDEVRRDLPFDLEVRDINSDPRWLAA